MTYLELSKAPMYPDVKDVIDYLLDNGYCGVVNDITGSQVEYELDDLIQVWSNLYNRFA